MKFTPSGGTNWNPKQTRWCQWNLQPKWLMVDRLKLFARIPCGNTTDSHHRFAMLMRYQHSRSRRSQLPASSQNTPPFLSPSSPSSTRTWQLYWFRFLGFFPTLPVPFASGYCQKQIDRFFQDRRFFLKHTYQNTHTAAFILHAVSMIYFCPFRIGISRGPVDFWVTFRNVFGVLCAPERRRDVGLLPCLFCHW